MNLKIVRPSKLFLLIAVAALSASAADTVLWDSSGDNLLSGVYNFREVMWRNRGDTHRIAMYGTLTFDGNGNYSLSGSVMDSNNSGVQTFSTTGTYRIAASGMGFMDDPIRSTGGTPLSAVWGLVSQGVFIASSTDDGINNLLIAARAPASTSNASFNGSYWAAGVNLPSGDVSQGRDMLFQLNPNGQGSLGTLSLKGLIGSNGSLVSQTVNAATYSAANGALTLAFGGSGALLTGSELCYLSADGNFFFGGSATGWDMLVGMRAFPGDVPASALQGMYYQAGVDVKGSEGFNSLATYYGSFTAGSGTIIGHQRVLKADPALQYAPFDYTYSDSFSLASDGSHDDFLELHNVVGAGGAIRIGFGNSSRLGINISLRAPDFSGSGVYLKPNGLANAASSAPFTAGVSPGGFIALYGTNLAAATAQDDRMPFTLGGVQVLINGRQAPVYYVRSDVVLAIVPFATSGGVASVQVKNGSTSSNTIFVRVKNSTPGIYTNPPGGVGFVIAQHVQDNSYATITRQNPARAGETILMYLTGLGAVTPPLDDGKPAPVDHITNAVTKPVVLVDFEQANVGFAGLTPTIVGLYAITVTIPADIGPGNVYVDIALPDSRTSEAQIPIGINLLSAQPEAPRLLREKRAAERAPEGSRPYPVR